MPTRIARRHLAASVLTLAALSACAGDDPPVAERAADSTTAAGSDSAPRPGAAEPGVAIAQVTRERFATLRWIIGRWRGVDAGATPTVAPFFEEYTAVNDTVIMSRTFADSTFARATDSSSIRLVGGRVESGSASTSWVVQAWDGDRVAFAPLVGATNSFIWERVADDQWKATLSFRNGSRRVYDMRKVR